MYKSDEIKEVTVEATSYCNARCPQCDRFDMKNNTIVPLKHLSLETIKKINKQSLPNLQKVLFEGACGDILNHPQALEIAKCFSDVDELIFVTNASIRNTKYFENLAEVKNLKIIFSIDGLEDTNHLYRQNTNFKKIIDNARAFINAGGYAIWKFIVFEHNEHQFDEVKQLSADLGFKKFEYQHSDRSWHQGDSWPVYNKNVYQFDLKPSTKVNKSDKLASDYSTLSQDLTYKAKNLQLPIECPSRDRGEIFVEYNGNVIPCCMLANDFWNNNFNSKFLFSLLKQDKDSINLNYHNFDKIFNSDFYINTLPQSLKNRPMPKCIQFCGKTLQKNT